MQPNAEVLRNDPARTIQQNVCRLLGILHCAYCGRTGFRAQLHRAWFAWRKKFSAAQKTINGIGGSVNDCLYQFKRHGKVLTPVIECFTTVLYQYVDDRLLTIFHGSGVRRKREHNCSVSSLWLE